MRLALCLMLVLTVSSAALGQSGVDPAGSTTVVAADAPGRIEAERVGRARFIDPEDGQLDLSYFLENPRHFLPIPIVVTEPAVGYGGGIAGMFLRPRREAGDEGWARPDLSVVGGLGTQNGTWAGFAGDASRWVDGRVRTLAAAGAGQFNLDFYGVGRGPSSVNEGVRYSLRFAGSLVQVNWQLAPSSPWAVGVRYAYAHIDPTPADPTATATGAGQNRVKISAPTAIVEFDTRDNVFTPTRGIYAESSWLASRKALGATEDFERFQQVLIGWLPLRHDVTLGARGNYAWTSDGAPFFVRPFVQLRGVPAVRYQGEQAASLEVEARWQFIGRWSVVAFAGAGTARSERQTFSASQNVGSGGVGMRYQFASKFGLHTGIDVAHSPGTNAIYLVVGNAWFRP